ncbi:GNAT family N-acetyltransferase [Actinokineospora auranticolor]|uniref:GNAT family N-acetyltransferase n=1 Tax=Actinokineospora auranticolor TaxID=155976 RepID=UPI001C67CD8B|nr:GNAT family N-acetyltransferase [Actinokineospora auranticolor]
MPASHSQIRHPNGHVFTDPLGGVPDDVWDRAAGDRFYSSAFWLRLVALEPGAVSGGVHVDLPGGGSAAVPVADVEDASELANPHLRWTELLTERGLPTPPARGLLVGQRRGYLAHLLATPDADRAEATSTLLEAVRAVGPSGHDVARVALYLTTPDVLALRAAGVEAPPVALAADAWIDIPDGGFDAWLAAGSKHQRSRVRSEVRKFEAAGYRVEHRTLPDAYAEVGRLSAQTERRYGIEADPAAYVEAFRKHAELAGDRAHVLLCSVGDEEPVGSCLYMHEGDTVYIRAVGFDYDELRDAAEYFNLHCYVPARLPGVRRIHCGIGTADGKAFRGAELSPLWLLDLTEGSPLIGRDDDVLAHNRAMRAALAAKSPVVERAMPAAEWDLFC